MVLLRILSYYSAYHSKEDMFLRDKRNKKRLTEGKRTKEMGKETNFRQNE